MKTKISKHSDAVMTAAPVTLPPLATATPVVPEFVRLPKRGYCPWSGLTRSALNGLILPSAANGHKPPVHSFALRQRGKSRGCRLIVLASLLEYLRKQAAAQLPKWTASAPESAA